MSLRGVIKRFPPSPPSHHGIPHCSSFATCRLPEMIFDFMLKFPDSWRVNMSAMQNFVLLARPNGSREGCLFQSRVMRESLSVGDGLLGDKEGRCKKRHGILIIFDAMDRFWDNPDVMAKACWSLVNISLVDRHKVEMIQLGAIQKVLAAVRNHPNSWEVAYRALFCLINFVAPTDGEGHTSLGTTMVEQVVNRDDAWYDKESSMTVRGQLEDVLQTTIFCVNKWIQDVEIISKTTLVFHNLSVVYEREVLLMPGCLSALRNINKEYENYGRIKGITECIMHELYEAMRRDEQLEIDFINMSRTQQSKR